MKKRFIKYLPTILAGISWGVIWYYFPSAHPFIIAMIWMDKSILSRKIDDIEKYGK